MDLYASHADKGARPQEIVLLEESDLYKYDHQPQYAMADIPRHNGMRANASFQPASDVGSERSAYTRPPYHAHATPYGPASTVRKPSMTSIDTVPMSHGALRPGGAVDLFSRQYIGLLLNWSLVGFFNGSLSALTAPFFQEFLGYTDYQTGAASTLINVPWNFKFLMGFLSDCFPIHRQRRKPYIYIGWTAFFIFFIAMTCMNEPRWVEDDKNAASQGPRYVIAIMIGSMGHLLSTVCCEGMMVEFAQREGEFARGRTMMWCVISRFIGETIGTMAMAFSINSKEFGGNFADAVPMRVIFGAHAVLSAFGIMITKFFLHEDLTATSSQRLTTQFRRIWNIMQKKTTWQITLFGFFAKIGTNYEIPGHGGILTRWLKAEPIFVNVNDAISAMGFIIGAAIYMRFLLNTNWRKLYIAVVAISIVFMVPVDIVTVYDIERNLGLYLSKAQLVAACDAIVFLIRIVVIVEVAEPGYEAVTYGILTTVFNLGSTVVSMVKNVVTSKWDPKETSTKYDTSVVRDHFMRAYAFKYGLRILVVLLVLGLLPRQKRHLKELNLRGAPNLVIPIVLFVIFAILFVTSMTSNLMALFESTACLVFAGGSGC